MRFEKNINKDFFFSLIYIKKYKLELLLYKRVISDTYD